MHTDFPLLRLYAKPQGVVDLKQNIQIILHSLGSVEGVHDFLIKAH